MTDAAPGEGHNSVLNETAQGRLRSFVERIERLEEDKAQIMQDLREVFQEVKGEGFSVPILRAVIRRRKKDPAKLAEEEAIMDLYLAALGEFR